MFSTNVKNTCDLMSIALQAEREAIRRYTDLSQAMLSGNNPKTAALFKRMIVEEIEHERLLLEWMFKEGIKENPEIEPVKWKSPNISTIYNEEAHDPYYSTPYKALAFAVHNEEIAFHFYTHVAANSANNEVKKYAEILAREELGHASLLRAERRIAYHQEQQTNEDKPRLNPKAIHNKEDLLASAIYIDRYLKNRMTIISDNNPKINSLISTIQQQINDNEEALNLLSQPGKEIMLNLQELESNPLGLNQKLDNLDLELQRLWSCCDRSFAFYDAVVETTDDETILLTAQSLSCLSLNRIACLKEILDDTNH